MIVFSYRIDILIFQYRPALAPSAPSAVHQYFPRQNFYKVHPSIFLPCQKMFYMIRSYRMHVCVCCAQHYVSSHLLYYRSILEHWSAMGYDAYFILDLAIFHAS